MIYFLCFLLFITLVYGKASGWEAFGLVVIDVSLIFAILKVGGWF